MRERIMATRARQRPPIRRPALGLMLCGLALALSGFAVPSPAAAFGGMGFGHMGGFGGMGMGHGPGYGAGAGRGMRQPTMVPRRGGKIVERPPVVNKGNPGGGDGGRGPTHHPIIGHPIGIGRPPDTNISQSPPPNGSSRFGGAGGGGGGGGGGMPPRGERRFVPDEVITAFSSNSTPQSIDQLARRLQFDAARIAKLSVDRQPLLSLAD